MSPEIPIPQEAIDRAKQAAYAAWKSGKAEFGSEIYEAAIRAFLDQASREGLELQPRKVPPRRGDDRGQATPTKEA